MKVATLGPRHRPGRRPDPRPLRDVAQGEDDGLTSASGAPRRAAVRASAAGARDARLSEPTAAASAAARRAAGRRPSDQAQLRHQRRVGLDVDERGRRRSAWACPPPSDSATTRTPCRDGRGTSRAGAARSAVAAPAAGTSTSTGVFAFSPRGVSTRTRARCGRAVRALHPHRQRCRRGRTTPRRRRRRTAAGGFAPMLSSRYAPGWCSPPRGRPRPPPRSPGAGRGRARPWRGTRAKRNRTLRVPPAGTPPADRLLVHLVAELRPHVEAGRVHLAAVGDVHPHLELAVHGLDRARQRRAGRKRRRPRGRRRRGPGRLTACRRGRT